MSFRRFRDFANLKFTDIEIIEDKTSKWSIVITNLVFRKLGPKKECYLCSRLKIEDEVQFFKDLELYGGYWIPMSPNGNSEIFFHTEEDARTAYENCVEPFIIVRQLVG